MVACMLILTQTIIQIIGTDRYHFDGHSTWDTLDFILFDAVHCRYWGLAQSTQFISTWYDLLFVTLFYLLLPCIAPLESIPGEKGALYQISIIIINHWYSGFFVHLHEQQMYTSVHISTSRDACNRGDALNSQACSLWIINLSMASAYTYYEGSFRGFGAYSRL